MHIFIADILKSFTFFSILFIKTVEKIIKNNFEQFKYYYWNFLLKNTINYKVQVALCKKNE